MLLSFALVFRWLLAFSYILSVTKMILACRRLRSSLLSMVTVTLSSSEDSDWDLVLILVSWVFLVICSGWFFLLGGALDVLGWVVTLSLAGSWFVLSMVLGFFGGGGFASCFFFLSLLVNLVAK